MKAGKMDNEEHLQDAWNKLVACIKTLPQNEQSVLIIYAHEKMKLQQKALAEYAHKYDLAISELSKVLNVKIKEIKNATE